MVAGPAPNEKPTKNRIEHNQARGASTINKAIMGPMSAQQRAQALIADPVRLGAALGYDGFRPGLHDRWIKRMVRGAGDMTLQAHRGSYKTTCLCVAIALMMIYYRNKNIIFLRKTDTDVVEVVKNVVRILKSDIFRQIYLALTGEELSIVKETSTEATTSAYNAPRGAAQLLGMGIGGSITGKHADIVITDDIVNAKDRVSAAEREKTKAAYMELQNIRNPGGRILNTGTPWHPEDAFSIMPPPVVFDCYTTGLLTADEIAKLRASMEPSLFAANYELKHIASGNALFATSPKMITDESMLRDGIAHVDAAYGGEDYTALTCARRSGDTIYMYGKLWRKHVDTVMDAIQADCERLMCAPVYCETNADKGYLGRELRKREISVRMYPEKMNKYHKISTFLRKWWGNIVFLEGTDKEYINQILDYNEQAEHDDAPDSAACVCRILDRRE